MKYKKSSIPEPSLGEDYSNEVDQVVPDQSMSLDEILTRFVRGEALPVGMDVQEGDEDADPTLSNVDLEKLANSDLVDKAEFVDRLTELQKKYNDQEKEKARLLAEKKQKEYEALDQKRIRLAAKKLAAKESTKKLA